MSLKWKAALSIFITALLSVSISVEYMLRKQSDLLLAASDKQIHPEYLVMADNTWLIIIIIAFLLSLIAFIISNRIAFKINELVVGISKAGGGNYNHRIVGESSGEVGQLITSYNRMLDNMLSGSQEIKEQLENYKTILENAAEGIISINDRGVIEKYNQSAEDIFGYKADEIIGKNITRIIPTKQMNKHGEEIGQSFVTPEGEPSRSREVTGIRKDGQSFPIELSVSESTINNAQIFTGILRDITNRKKDRLKQKNLKIQLRKLQKQRSLESLSNGITHDFNNILGPILGYADMAVSEAEEGTKIHKHLTNVLKGALKARELVSRIMRYSQHSEEAEQALHLSPLIDESLLLVKSSLPTEHQLRTFINTTNDLIMGEKTLLAQVLVTLATNATQAMENKPGTLTIRLDNIYPDESLIARSGQLNAEEYVRLRVEDTGKGMDAVTQTKIFEPFFTTWGDSEHCGLGLSVAYGIVSDFGGDILVESEPEKGSVFSVFFPVINKHEENFAVDEKPDEKPALRGGELILYVDDEHDVAEVGREMLESLGYEVALATKSLDALDVFRSDPEDFDLVITDQSMPVLKGTQLAREIKKIRADIPVILVSGFSASILSREMIDTGIEYCIAKPLVINELAQVVSRALSNPSS